MIALLERVSAHGLSRDDLREETRRRRPAPRGERPKPFVFRFKDPDKSFNLAISFRKSEVERDDLIQALERILADLRRSGDEEIV